MVAPWNDLDEHGRKLKPESPTVNAFALADLLTGKPTVVVNPRRRRNPGEPKKRLTSFRPKVDEGAVWLLYTTSTYQSADLPAIATREALQNSVDAIRAAVAAGEIQKGQGRFEVTWDAGVRSLTWDDNGIGMDTETLAEKFLSIGSSTKRGSATQLNTTVRGFRRAPNSGDGSYYIRLNGLFQFRRDKQGSGKMPLDVVVDYTTNGQAGGFGVAKAVILGVSPTFRFEMHTRDNLAESKGKNPDGSFIPGKIDLVRWRQGTRLTVFEVAVRSWEDPVVDRLRNLLQFNDLPDITLVLNGEVIRPAFDGKRGKVIADGGSWGSNPVPGTAGYPFNTGRDNLTAGAADALYTLSQQVEQEAKNITSATDDVEQIDPDGDAQGDDFAELSAGTAEAFEDPTFLKALATASGAVADINREEAKAMRGASKRSAGAAGSSAPAGKTSPELSSGTERGALPEDTARVLDGAADQQATLARGLEALAVSDKDRAGQGMSRMAVQDAAVEAAGVALTELTAGAGDQIGSLVRMAGLGAYADRSDISDLRDASDQAVTKAFAPGGGGLVQAAAVMQATNTLLKAVHATPVTNPFGKLAGLRIYKKLSDRAYVYRFKKNWSKHLPLLTCWDAILRLMAKAGDVRYAFKPGFVFNDERMAEAAIPGNYKPALILLNPQWFYAYIKANKTRPWAIAAYFMGSGAHELAHVKARTGSSGDHKYSHDDSFSSIREDIGDRCASLLPAATALVVNLLSLDYESPEQAQIRTLTKAVEKTRTAVAECRREAAAAKKAMEQHATGRECPTCAINIKRVDLATRRADLVIRHADLANRLETLGFFRVRAP